MSDIQCPHCKEERDADVDDYGADGDETTETCPYYNKKYKMEAAGNIEDIIQNYHGNWPEEDEMGEIIGVLTQLLQTKRQKRDEAVEAERERIWKVAGEHRYEYEEDGKLDRFSQGANAVVKAIWTALGGKPDPNDRDIWKRQPTTPPTEDLPDNKIN